MGEGKNITDLMENKEIEVAVEVPKNMVEEKPKTAKVGKAMVKTTANLRSEEVLNDKNVLCVVNKGEVVDVLEKKGRFYKIKCGKHEGFMMANLLILL